MRKHIGTCTQCGKENTALTTVDESIQVCEECLDAVYFQCDECGEYWDDSYVEMFFLKDGRTICEYCRENFDDEEIDSDP
jgi:hypothetical protein